MIPKAIQAPSEKKNLKKRGRKYQKAFIVVAKPFKGAVIKRAIMF